MNRFHKLLLAAFVARGAEWLDTHYAGWAQHLLGYIGSIFMVNPRQCVIGTLLRTDFFNGMGQACGAHDRDENGDIPASAFWTFLEKNGLGSGKEYGFNIPEDGDDCAYDEGWESSEEWSVLMEAWEQEMFLRVTPEIVAGALGKAERQRMELVQKMDSTRDRIDMAERSVAITQEAYDKAVDAFRTAASEAANAESMRDDARVDLEDSREHVERVRKQHATVERQRSENVRVIENLQQYLTQHALQVTLDLP